MTKEIININKLEKYYDTDTSAISGLKNLFTGKSTPKVQAVDSVSMKVSNGSRIGIIGESGCGKSTLLSTIAGLESPTGGSINYKGVNTQAFDNPRWKKFRREVQMVFQNPFDSLNPKFTVRETLLEPLRIHNIGNREEKVIKALEDAGLTPPGRFLDSYPDDLSGGEQQRVSIARAIILEPDILLADEPVSMLDVSTQAAVLNLLDDLIEKRDMGLVYVSHDLTTVGYLCDEIKVMYLGRVVEEGNAQKIIDNPEHPYTRALIKAIPTLNPNIERERTDLPGSPATPIDLGEGCRFRDRCPKRMDVCDKNPKKIKIDENHTTACHLHYDHDKYLSANGSNFVNESQYSNNEVIESEVES